MLKRLIRSKSWMLTLGSALASAFNFYSYIVFPARVGLPDLDRFVQDNYLGGLYLFGIGSSIAPFSMFVLTAGRAAALRRYLLLSMLVVIGIGGGGFWLARVPWSYLCLCGAVLMHAAGFYLASLIRDEKMFRAAAMQAVQPLIFAALITSRHFALLPQVPWAVLYLLSTIACFGGFFLLADRDAIAQELRATPTASAAWGDILLRTALCVGFPLFFQLELILCGKTSQVGVGFYAVLQKLYSSVSISLFGSVGVLLLAQSAKEPSARIRLLDRNGLALATLCALCVPLVGFVSFYTGRGHLLDIPLVAGTAVISFLFTLSSLATLKLTAFRPGTGLKAFAGAMALYAALFLLFRPATAGRFLTLSGCFFGSFLGLALWFGQRDLHAPGDADAIRVDLTTGTIEDEAV